MLAIRSGVDRELRQRPRRRLAIAAAVAGVLLVIGIATAPRWRIGGASAPIAGAPLKPARDTLMVLDDGSTVQPLSETARVEPVENGTTKQALRLASGSARFEVTPRQKRSFEVRALDVTVSVLGTAFVVAIEGSAVRVQVEHGRVRVTWPGGTRELSGGEQAAFDAPKAATSVEALAPAPVPEPSAQRPPPLPSW